MTRRTTPDDKTRIGPDEQTLAGYTVLERVGARSSTVGAAVYRAKSPEGRPVLLRFLGDDQTSMEEKQELASRCARLQGVALPHVVPTLAVFGGDRPFVVCPEVNASDLGAVVGRSGPLGALTAVGYLIQAARGLDGAAARGVLHGDLRPPHLLLVDGEVQVGGFSSAPSWQTAHGRFVRGDPAYLAPEVAAGRRPDVRADIYSLACTFYELITGRAPFGAFSPDALIACHVHEPFPLARRIVPSVPAPLDALLAEMAAKDPGRRPQSYDELIERAATVSNPHAPHDDEPPLLVVEAGRQAGMSVVIPEGTMLLGRTVGDGFVVDDGRISRRHALLHRRGREVRVEDLGSRNGIKVNGARVKERVLAPGDKISLGDTVLRIDGCDPPLVEEITGSGETPSSPVRGAFGAKELVHAPGRRSRAKDLADFDDPLVAALAVLAVHLAPGGGALDALYAAALDAARRATRAQTGVVVRIGRDGPLPDAKSAAEAQTLSVVMPAVERALPGQLSVITSVRADREAAWSTALAPLVDDLDRVLAYLVVVRPDEAFEPVDLTVLEAIADLVSQRLGHPPDAGRGSDRRGR